MKVGVLLSGNGVFDGSEIQEAVFTFLAIDRRGGEIVAMAPNIDQHHVLNHLTGDEMDETRNVLVESARIARGNIRDMSKVTAADMDALAIPGGFGAAKNLTKWAFSGPDGDIDPQVKRIIQEMWKAGKPIAAMCMGPTVIAKALEGLNAHEHLTVGSTEEPSPYDIAAISAGMNAAGAVSEMKTIQEVLVDEKNKIVTAPCYMMDATITEVYMNIEETIEALFDMLP
jgi:enhancing lycopene biosynthesis protein 2